MLKTLTPKRIPTHVASLYQTTQSILNHKNCKATPPRNCHLPTAVAAAATLSTGLKVWAFNSLVQAKQASNFMNSWVRPAQLQNIMILLNLPPVACLGHRVKQAGMRSVVTPANMCLEESLFAWRQYYMGTEERAPVTTEALLIFRCWHLHPVARILDDKRAKTASAYFDIFISSLHAMSSTLPVYHTYV
eukprot:1154738-Pelagomonas_calceolata.AAC.4